MVATKLIIQHLLISIIVLCLFAFFQEAGIIFVPALTLLLYVLSGYFSYAPKVKTVEYYSVAIMGIILCLFCFIKSPESLNWKGSGGIWLLYELMFASKSIFSLYPFFENLGFKGFLIMNFIFPLFISGLQILGSKIRIVVEKT